MTLSEIRAQRTERWLRANWRKVRDEFWAAKAADEAISGPLSAETDAPAPRAAAAPDRAERPPVGKNGAV